MTKLFIALIAVTIMLYGALVISSPREVPASPVSTTSSSSTRTIEPDTLIARNLSIPWDIAFLPDSSMLVTERTGTVIHIDTQGSTTRTKISGAVLGEAGLLGIALHPDFEHNHFVYLYMSETAQDGTLNKVVRFKYVDGLMQKDADIITGIPGATYHDGGRVEFGPDGKLYITTGDATHGAIAQDTNSLGGKILRLNDDGTIPSDNPFGNAVWSYGHRNPQGLAWDDSGVLWETEHGPTGEEGRCCHDEINRIEKGKNYGWPTIIGDEAKPDLMTPAWNSKDETWAPASLVYFEGALYFGGLKGTAIYRADIKNGMITGVRSFSGGVYGRVRTIRVGPDHMFYITTSNTDGRGRPLPDDDRIVRIDPLSVK